MGQETQLGGISFIKLHREIQMRVAFNNFLNSCPTDVTQLQQFICIDPVTTA